MTTEKIKDYIDDQKLWLPLNFVIYKPIVLAMNAPYIKEIWRTVLPVDIQIL